MDEKIEEMAKVLLETSCKGSECENCAFVKSVEEAKETCVCLKAFYNAGYRKESDTVKEVLGKVLKFTLDDEVGMRYLIKNLAKEYGVELK